MKNLFKLLPILALACGDVDLSFTPVTLDAGTDSGVESSDVTCGTTEESFEEHSELGTVKLALGQAPYSFGLYGSANTDGRLKDELWRALEIALTRWRNATCLPLDLSLEGAVQARWQHGDDMPNNYDGLAGQPWMAGGYIQMAADLSANKVVPVLIHEIGHHLRKHGGHPGPDGSMSWPVTHVNSEPVSKILQYDVSAVCAKHTCGCQVPE